MNRRVIGLLMGVLLGVGSVIAQTNGDSTAVIVLSSFEKVVSRGNVQLVIVPSETEHYAMTVERHGIAADGYTYRMRKGELRINVPNGLFKKNEGYIKVYLNTPTISVLDIKGAEVEFASPVRTSSFSLLCSGENSARLWLDVENLKVNISGNSDVALRGKTRSGNFSAQLGSRIDGMHLSADSLWVRSNEGSEVYAKASELLYAKVATGGTVYYDGKCKVLKKDRTWGNVLPISKATKSFTLGGETIKVSDKDVERVEDVDSMTLPRVEPESVKHSDGDFF